MEGDVRMAGVASMTSKEHRHWKMTASTICMEFKKVKSFQKIAKLQMNYMNYN